MNGSTDYKFGEIETTLKNTANDLEVWKQEEARRYGSMVSMIKEVDKKVTDLSKEFICLREEFIGYKIKMGMITAGVALVASVGTSVVTALIINGLLK